MSNKPLSDITVLDLSRVLAGPYCTMVLNDLGAEIIKVERPGTGDDSRSFGPFIEGKSGYFISINRGKKSIALNLKDEEDRDIFLKLVEKVDVVVENFRPGAMERLGFSYEELKKINPQIIYTAISGFGHTGPYSERAAYDIIVQAAGGIMSITGEPDGPPIRVGASVGDIIAALFAINGILAAIHQREKTGEGQKVDVSMLDSQIAILENAVIRYAATGESPGPLGNRHPSITPFEAFKASDGWAIIAAGNDDLWHKFCQAVEREDLIDKAEFETNDKRTENREELKTIINDIIKDMTVDEVVELLTENGVPSTPINKVEDIFADPQVQQRNMLVDVKEDISQDLKIAGNPIKMSGNEDKDYRDKAPGLDENREEILAKFLND